MVRITGRGNGKAKTEVVGGREGGKWSGGGGCNGGGGSGNGDGEGVDGGGSGVITVVDTSVSVWTGGGSEGSGIVPFLAGRS